MRFSMHIIMAGWFAGAGLMLVAQPQAPPVTDIFLADFGSSQEGAAFKVEQVRNITNRDSYDNQPFFLPDGRLLYSSMQDGKQTDIYRYDPGSGTSTQITHTAEHEYSPTLMPDGKHLSAVRIEADGKTQRLWRFGLDGTNPELVMTDVQAVGYHAWLGADRLALLIVSEPLSLQVALVESQKVEQVMVDIGRCLAVIPGQDAFSVVRKPAQGPWMIERVDAKTLKVEPLVATLEGAEDYAWSGGALFMAADGKLHRFQPGKDKAWVAVADLSGAGLKQVNRIAISPDMKRIALVAVR